MRRGFNVVRVGFHSVYKLRSCHHVRGGEKCRDRLHRDDEYGVQSTVRRGYVVVCDGVRSVFKLLSQRHVRGCGGRRDRLH